MKRPSRELLNKEKAMSVLAALAFSAGLYHVLASQPVSLQSERPLTTTSGPARFVQTTNDDAVKLPADLGGPRNPFKKFVIAAPLPKPEVKAVLKIEVPPPPAENGTKKFVVDDPAKRPFDPKSIGLEYVGVVSVEGKSCALLRTKNTGARRVAPGECVDGIACRVTKIEQQSVWLRDENGAPFVLKNTRF